MKLADPKTGTGGLTVFAVTLLGLTACLFQNQEGEEELETYQGVRAFLFPDVFSLESLALEADTDDALVTGAQELAESGDLQGARVMLTSAPEPDAEQARDYWLLLAHIHNALGDPDAARSSLSEILRLPDIETRLTLSCWHLLRELGHEPPPDVADQILGVVVDVAAEGDGMITTVAGYVDGTPRLLASNGTGVLGESRDFSGLPRFAARNLVESARSLAGSFPRVEDHDLPPFGSIRISLLTPGGIRARTEKIDALSKDFSRTAGAGQQVMGALVPLLGRGDDGTDAETFRRQEEEREAAALAAAVRAADTARLGLLLEEVDADVQDGNGATALMTAAHLGSTEAARILIGAGVNLETRDSSGYTALMYAANAGQLEVAEALVEAGGGGERRRQRPLHAGSCSPPSMAFSRSSRCSPSTARIPSSRATTVCPRSASQSKTATSP